MMIIDMTNELAPLIFAMNAALVAAGLAVLVSALPARLRVWERLRVPTLHRPVLAGH